MSLWEVILAILAFGLVLRVLLFVLVVVWLVVLFVVYAPRFWRRP